MLLCFETMATQRQLKSEIPAKFGSFNPL